VHHVGAPVGTSTLDPTDGGTI